MKYAIKTKGMYIFLLCYGCLGVGCDTQQTKHLGIKSGIAKRNRANMGMWPRFT